MLHALCMRASVEWVGPPRPPPPWWGVGGWRAGAGAALIDRGYFYGKRLTLSAKVGMAALVRVGVMAVRTRHTIHTRIS